MFDHLDDPTPYEPSAELRAATVRRGRSLKRRRRAVLGSAVACVAVLAGFAAMAATATVVDRKLDEVQTVDVPNLRTTAEPGDPKVILFVGADSDAGSSARDPNRPSGSARADTILLARADPGKETVTLLSIPRDLLVDIPGRGQDRINAAYAYGGPELLVEAIDQNLGIEVDAYPQTDFRGAAAVGDALGGLSLSFPAPLRDRNTGLDLPAGCVELDGSQLVTLGRSRHVRYFDQEDGVWRRDPTSDLGRTARQQAIATALFERLATIDRTNPRDALRLLDAVVAEVTVDSGTTGDDLLALFRAIEGSTPQTIRYPVADRVHEGAAVLELADGADQVTAAFLDVDDPQPPSAPTATSNPSVATTTGPMGDLLSDPSAPGDDIDGSPHTYDDGWQAPAASLPTPC